MKPNTIEQRAFERAEVAAVFHSYPTGVREKLLSLRQLIFDTASEAEGVGKLEETLKWGQPSYLTTKPKSGTTIRIDRHKAQEGQYGIYFHCQSGMIATLRQIYPTQFVYEGNRGIIFHENDELPLEELSHCILLALTYHQRKSSNRVLPK